MNAERLDIARRLVACPKWVWLPGMRAIQPADPRHTESARLTYSIAGTRFGTDSHNNDRTMWVFDGMYQCLGAWPWLPDLDDDLTRLGVLAVVRRAWGPMAYVETPSGTDRYGMPVVRPAWRVLFGGNVWVGPTEESAMLAALDAAP